jgi:hypothetical protein
LNANITGLDGSLGLLDDLTINLLIVIRFLTREEKNASDMVACLFVSLWPIIPTGSFFNNWINVIYYLPIGFLIWDIRRNKI